MTTEHAAEPTPTTLQSLFHSVNPTNIWYRKSGEKPQLISIKEFEKRVGIIWTNSPVADTNLRNALFCECNFPRILSLQITEALCQAPDNFTIGEINDTVGNGVFFTPQRPNEILKQGDTIGLYSGILLLGDAVDPYSYRVDYQDDKNVLYAKGVKETYYDAQRFRNLTSFVQHAPTKEKLDTLNIPEELKPYVVAANAGFSPALHFGIPVLYGVMLRNTEAGEQVFFDYGDAFEGKPYQIFDNENNVIGIINAEKQFERNLDYKPGCTKPAKHCKAGDSKKAVKKASDKEILLADTSSQRFIENVKFIIDIYQKKSIPRTESLFKRLLECLSEQYTARDIHEKILKIAIDIDTERFAELFLLKQELTIYLEIYNSTLNQANAEKAKLHAKTKSPWEVREIDKKLCFFLFGKTGELTQIKQKFFSNVTSTIQHLNARDALIVCFSQLLLQNKLNEEKAAQAQARKVGEK